MQLDTKHKGRDKDTGLDIISKIQSTKAMGLRQIKATNGHFVPQDLTKKMD